MPLLSSRASASAKSFGLTVLSALTSVIDFFNRSDASTLGSAKGQKWKTWRGVWSIVNNKASSSSSPGDNALATLKFTKTDVTVSISGAAPGTGASFWVTDANNWYASVYTQSETCQTCSNCNAFNTSNCNAFNPSNCNAFNPSNCNAFNPVTCNAFNPSNCAVTTPGNCSNSPQPCCGGFNNSNCKAFSPGNCTAWNNTRPKGFCGQRSPPTCTGGFNTSNCRSFCCNGTFPTWSPYCSSFNTQNCSSFSGGNCNSFNTANCNSFNTANCNSFNTANCNSFFSFSCNCVVEHRMSLIKSIASTVSTVSSSLFSAAVQSFKVSISGNQATVSAYSNSSYSSQIGNSLSSSMENPQKTSQHGIIKSSSTYQQGSSIDEFGAN